MSEIPSNETEKQKDRMEERIVINPDDDVFKKLLRPGSGVAQIVYGTMYSLRQKGELNFENGEEDRLLLSRFDQLSQDKKQKIRSLCLDIRFDNDATVTSDAARDIANIIFASNQ